MGDAPRRSESVCLPLLNPARAHFTDALSFVEAPATARAGIQEVQPIHGEVTILEDLVGVNGAPAENRTRFSRVETWHLTT